jgi:hypothetical protein
LELQWLGFVFDNHRNVLHAPAEARRNALKSSFNNPVKGRRPHDDAYFNGRCLSIFGGVFEFSIGGDSDMALHTVSAQWKAGRCRDDGNPIPLMMSPGLTFMAPNVDASIRILRLWPLECYWAGRNYAASVYKSSYQKRFGYSPSDGSVEEFKKVLFTGWLPATIRVALVRGYGQRLSLQRCRASDSTGNLCIVPVRRGRNGSRVRI